MDIGGLYGTVVRTPANARVLYAQRKSAYGNLIVLDHGGGITTRFGHLSRFEVQVGDQVQKGDIIGYVAAGGYGPVVEKSIGLAYLPTDFLAPGTELSVELVGKERTATVVEQPLYDPENKKLLS